MGPEHRSTLCLCQLFPIRPTGKVTGAPPAHCHGGDGGDGGDGGNGWALGREVEGTEHHASL